MENKKYVPQEVTDVDMAFGGKIEKLLPKMDEIPKEFFEDANEWNRQVSKWFFGGATEYVAKVKEGIDKKMALRHIGAILGSFSPKHEHKMAGAAFLASQFFEEFKIIK